MPSGRTLRQPTLRRGEQRALKHRLASTWMEMENDDNDDDEQVDDDDDDDAAGNGWLPGGPTGQPRSDQHSARQLIKRERPALR